MTPAQRDALTDAFIKAAASKIGSADDDLLCSDLSGDEWTLGEERQEIINETPRGAELIDNYVHGVEDLVDQGLITLKSELDRLADDAAGKKRPPASLPPFEF